MRELALTGVVLAAIVGCGREVVEPEVGEQVSTASSAAAATSDCRQHSTVSACHANPECSWTKLRDGGFVCLHFPDGSNGDLWPVPNPCPSMPCDWPRQH